MVSVSFIPTLPLSPCQFLYPSTKKWLTDCFRLRHGGPTAVVSQMLLLIQCREVNGRKDNRILFMLCSISGHTNGRLESDILPRTAIILHRNKLHYFNVFFSFISTIKEGSIEESNFCYFSIRTPCSFNFLYIILNVFI